MAESNLEVRIKAFVEGLDNLKELGAGLADTAKGAMDTGPAASEATAELKKLTDAAGSTQEKMGLLKEFLAGVQEALKAGLPAAMAAAGDKAGVLKATVDGLSEGLKDGLTPAVKDAGEETKKAGEKAKESSTLFEFFKDHLKEIIITAGLVEGSLKAIEFGKESLKDAEVLEDVMARVKVTAQGTAEEFDHLKEAVEEAALKTGSSTTQAAQGVEALAKAGFSAKEAYTALIPILNLAKVGQVDVSVAADTVSSAIHTFGLNTADTSHIVDVLTEASKGVIGGLQGMVGSFSRVSEQAKLSGADFATTAAAIRLVGQSGIPARFATSGLTQVFQELGRATSPLSEKLAGLAGRPVTGLADAIKVLYSQTDHGASVIKSFGNVTGSVLSALSKDGPQAFAGIVAGLQNVDGAAESAATVLDGTLSESFKTLKNAFVTVGGALAEPILKPFTAEFQKLAGEVGDFVKSEQFARLKEDVKKFAESAAEQLDKLIHGVHWNTFVEDAVTNLDRLATKLEGLGKTAENIAGAINKTLATFALIKDGLVGLTGQIQVNSAAITTVLNKGIEVAVKSSGLAFTDFGKRALVALNESNKAASETAKDGLANIYQGADDAREAMGAFSAATDKATVAAKAVGEGTNKAAEDFKILGPTVYKVSDSLKLVPDYMDDVGIAAKATDTSLEGMRASFLLTGEVVGKDVPDAFYAAGLALNAADDRLRAFVKSGVEDVAQLKDLQDQVIAAKGAYDALSPSVQDASRKSAEFKQAISDLHIDLDTLNGTATTTKAAFEQILKSEGATVDGTGLVARAFDQMAKATLASLDLATPAVRDQGLALLENQSIAAGTHAAFLKLVAADQNLGQASIDAAEKIKQESDRLRELHNLLNDPTPPTTGADGIKKVAGAAEQGDVKIKGMGKSANELNTEISNINTGGFASLSQALADTRAKFLGVSEAAAKAFDYSLLHNWRMEFDGTGVGFTKLINAMADANKEVTQTIAEQKSQLNSIVLSYQQMGDVSAKSFDKSSTALQYTDKQLGILITSIKEGTYDAGLLGKEDLGSLQAALEAAKQRVDALRQAALQATQQLQSMADSLRQTLLQDNNDQVALENIRHQKSIADINAQAAVAGDAGKAQAAEALALEDQVHQEKMAHIRQQQVSEQQANQQVFQQKQAQNEAINQQRVNQQAAQQAAQQASEAAGATTGLPGAKGGPSSGAGLGAAAAAAAGGFGLGGIGGSDVNTALQSIARQGAKALDTDAGKGVTVTFVQGDKSVKASVDSNDVSSLLDLLQRAAGTSIVS